MDTMRKFRSTTARRAYNVVVEFFRNGTPITVISLMNAGGYNSYEASAILKAITHSYTERNHGFNLQQMFEIKDGYLCKYGLVVPGVFDILAKAITYEYAIAEFQRHLKNAINKV